MAGVFDQVSWFHLSRFLYEILNARITILDKISSRSRTETRSIACIQHGCHGCLRLACWQWPWVLQQLTSPPIRLLLSLIGVILTVSEPFSDGPTQQLPLFWPSKYHYWLLDLEAVSSLTVIHYTRQYRNSAMWSDEEMNKGSYYRPFHPLSANVITVRHFLLPCCSMLGVGVRGD